jgi:hypothetical protein
MIGGKIESRDSPQWAAAFKGAMRRLASGVAIITTSHERRRYGRRDRTHVRVNGSALSRRWHQPKRDNVSPLGPETRLLCQSAFTKVTPICAHLFRPTSRGAIPIGRLV